MPITRCGKYLDLAPDLITGDGCRVWSFAVICPGVRMGHGCVIGSKVYVGKGATLGHEVHVQDGSHLTDGIMIGSYVFIGALVVTMNDKHPSVARSSRRWVDPKAYEAAHIRPPIIEDRVMIGCGAVILPGVRLGTRCQIGAGAVVTRDVPAGETWVGNPARLIHRPASSSSSSIADDLGIDVNLYAEVCCRPDAEGQSS
jgi:UDP-2-acetamido-3-amino-2,3-dideoxy-glucuronate N-acetyltransferase